MKKEQLNDDSPLSAASSSGTRTAPMPHFQHLLAGLQVRCEFVNVLFLMLEFGAHVQFASVSHSLLHSLDGNLLSFMSYSLEMHVDNFPSIYLFILCTS